MNYAFDLHLHSCLSPYGGDDMTPMNIAAMCALAGYDIVALTDYNSCGNSAAFQATAQAQGLLAVPGMELCVREDAHVMCLFPDLDHAFAFEKLVRERLTKIENDPAVFGSQVLMDEQNNVVGEDAAFLIGSCDIGVYEVVELVEQYGGVAYPAHLDQDSFSVLANLGLWDESMGFRLAEVTLDCPEEFFSRPELESLRFIRGSDAQTLDQVPAHSQYMDLPELTAAAVVEWLRGEKG